MLLCIQSDFLNLLLTLIILFIIELQLNNNTYYYIDSNVFHN